MGVEFFASQIQQRTELTTPANISVFFFLNINWKKFWNHISKWGRKLLWYLEEVYGSEFLCLRLLAERTHLEAHSCSGECLHSERRSDPLSEYVNSVWAKWVSQRALTLRSNFLSFSHNSVTSQCASEYWGHTYSKNCHLVLHKCIHVFL